MQQIGLQVAATKLRRTSSDDEGVTKTVSAGDNVRGETVGESAAHELGKAGDGVGGSSSAPVTFTAHFLDKEDRLLEAPVS